MAFRIPVSNGLLCREHYEAIGPALWEFLWLIDHITKEEKSEDGVMWGYVLGGKEVTFERIGADLGAPEPTVKKHIYRLIRAEYVQAERGRYGLKLRVARSKKFHHRDGPSEIHLTPDRPPVVHLTPDGSPDGPKRESRWTKTTPQMDQNACLRETTSGPSAARMTVQKTLHDKATDMRAGARGDLIRINALMPDGAAPKASEDAEAQDGKPAKPQSAPAKEWVPWCERPPDTRSDAELLRRHLAGKTPGKGK